MTAKRSRKGGVRRELHQNRILYLMCIPAFVLLLLFCYIPYIGDYMAFTDFNVVDGIFGSPFVGLRNFKFFFRSGMAAKVIYNTLYINIFNLILGLIIPIALAIAINEIKNQAFKKVTQSLMFFPYFLSWVVVGAIVYGLFSSDIGLINSLLVKLGKDPVRWYAEPKYWKWILILADVWKWSGYNSIIYYASVVGIDQTYYEAAMVDGASKWQQIKNVTLPQLIPMISVLLILNIGGIFRADFGLFYQVPRNSGALYQVTSVLDTYIYNGLTATGDFGMTAAAGLYQSVVGALLLLTANLVVRKLEPDSALF